MKSFDDNLNIDVDVYGNDEDDYDRDDIVSDYPDLADFYFFSINVRRDELDAIVIEEDSIMPILSPLTEMDKYLNLIFEDITFDIRTLNGTKLPNGWIVHEATGYRDDHSAFKVMYICKSPIIVSKKLH